MVLSTYPLTLAVREEAGGYGVGVVFEGSTMSYLIVEGGDEDSDKAYGEVREVDEMCGTTDAGV
jgi:hypothetical protein